MAIKAQHRALTKNSKKLIERTSYADMRTQKLTLWLMNYILEGYAELLLKLISTSK